MDICVGNLPRDVTARDLREIFEFFGRVVTAHLVRPRLGEESRGLGFVGMPAREEAVSAVLGVHGKTVKGQAITANEVQARGPVSGVCGTRCPCQSGKYAHGGIPSSRQGSGGKEEAMGQATMDWKKISGARSLMQSGFSNDLDIRSAILDRCLTAIRLDEIRSGRIAGITESRSECSSTEQMGSHVVKRRG